MLQNSIRNCRCELLGSQGAGKVVPFSIFNLLISIITCRTHTDRVSRNLIGSKPVCKSPYSPGYPAPMFAESVYRVNTTHKLKQCGLGRRCREITEFRPKNQLFLKNEEDVRLSFSSVD